jgi:thymidylate synthase (FAD)
VKETGKKYVAPPEIVHFPEIGVANIFQHVMDVCWASYDRLLERGVNPEIVRYVLPNACETQIICTWNFREIRHIIKLRTSKRALPEMRAVAGEIRRIAKEMAPQVFEDL